MNSKRWCSLICFIIFCSMVFAIPRCSQNSQPGEALSVIEELITIGGVSMHEEAVKEKIIQLLPENIKYRTDEKNNLLVTLGTGKPELLFIAHMDEIGLEVSRINEDGMLSIRSRGGSYPSIWESKVVKIYTKTGVIDGIIPPRPTYMDRSPEDYSRNNSVVYVGTETKEETEALGIQPGNFIVQPKRLMPLANGRYAGGSVDDRAGCAAQIMAVRRLAGKKLNKTVTFAWCVEEETGLTGSGFIAQSLSPEYVFAVDTFVSSDAPRDETNIGYTRLGDGAIIRAFDSSNITPREIFVKIRKIAENSNIPVQWGITSGGNDGSRFLEGGSYDIPLSWPGIYSHSFVSVFDMADIDALIDLIVAISHKL